ncbi:pyridoxamine 5-phosphate oxidase [Rhodobacterales bacterium HKCCE3408]|nr:pyridoxamine 5-phosphate oxidase [Rhodobacterales bacterium HKCCE3408]
MADQDPFRDPDEEARALARRLIAEARHGALAVTGPDGHPSVTRVALVPGPDFAPLTLVSDLSPHTAALRAHPRCSILIGEPGPKGDPLTHPRLTLEASAEQADKDALRAHYLSAYPKATLYYDFGDFRLFRLAPVAGLLNGGFGKAYRLTAGDLRPPG